jgi:hypothetical protein
VRTRILVLTFLVLFSVLGAAAAATYELSLARNDRNAITEQAQNYSFDQDGTAGVNIETGNVNTVPLQGQNSGTVELDVNIPDSIEIWHRENAYMMGQLAIRQRLAPLPLGNHVSSPEDSAQDAFRILVVGDSYVWGFGQFDLDRVWHRRLATFLSENGKPEGYEVMAIGHGGRSVVSYANYLTEDVISTLNPDLIMVGFLTNDWMPDEAESICSALETRAPGTDCAASDWYIREDYVKCMSGESNLLGSFLQNVAKKVFPRVANEFTERICESKSTPDDPLSKTERTAMLDNPESSEFWALYKETVKKIRVQAGSIPVAVLPLSTNYLVHKDEVYKVWRDAGFDVIANPATKKLLRSVQAEDEKSLWVNPADSHPNLLLNNAYAQDALAYVKEKFPTKQTSSADQKMALVSNFSPSSMSYITENEGNQVMFVHDADTEATKRQTVSNDIRGITRLPQQVPCAMYGRPHARVVLNPQVLTKDTIVKVTLEDSENTTLILSQVTYDTQGKQLFSKPLQLQKGSSVVLSFNAETTGFVIGTPTAGCNLNSKISLAPFRMTIKKI